MELKNSLLLVFGGEKGMLNAGCVNWLLTILRLLRFARNDGRKIADSVWRIADKSLDACCGFCIAGCMLCIAYGVAVAATAKQPPNKFGGGFDSSLTIYD
ncbi:hypothetical protein ES703_31970 [subsurface metagenome]